MASLNFNDWLDLSMKGKPSYALVLRQGSGSNDDKLVKYRKKWMTARQARAIRRINNDTASIDTSFMMHSLRVLAPKLQASNHHRFPIMALPFDVREKILEFDALDFVMEYSPLLQIAVYLRGYNGSSPTTIRLPPITQAGDRKLRLEAILVTIKLVTLEIHSGPGNAKLRKWLGSINLGASGKTSLRSGFDAVHSLYFPYFSRFPHHILPAGAPNNDIQLMRCCNNIRHVKINFVKDALYTDEGERKTVEYLRADYRLDTILELSSLRTLVLESRRIDYGDPALSRVKECFEREFAKRVHGVKVIVG